MADTTQIRREINRKYDAGMEKAVLDWIAGVMGEPNLFAGVSGPVELQKKLKNGVILCRLMNMISPGSTKGYKTAPKMPFHEMENLGYFNEAIRNYGVKNEYIFVTSDLYESKNLVQVLIGLRALGTVATKNGIMPAIQI